MDIQDNENVLRQFVLKAEKMGIAMFPNMHKNVVIHTFVEVNHALGLENEARYRKESSFDWNGLQIFAHGSSGSCRFLLAIVGTIGFSRAGTRSSRWLPFSSYNWPFEDVMLNREKEG